MSVVCFAAPVFRILSTRRPTQLGCYCFISSCYRSQSSVSDYDRKNAEQWLERETTEEIARSLIQFRRSAKKEAKERGPDDQLSKVYERHLGATDKNYQLCRLDDESFDENTLFDWFSSQPVVHAVQSIESLRRRMVPANKRLYGLFHRALLKSSTCSPAVVLQVSLQPTVPSTLAQVLTTPDDETHSIDNNTVATFYSISLLEPALGGLGLGELTIHLAVEDLLPTTVDSYVTLSPILEPFQCPQAAVRYILSSSSPSTATKDPVARFHLGNGAQLYRVNPPDPGFGGCCNVNYRYEIQFLEARRRSFRRDGSVSVSEHIALDPVDGSKRR